MEIHHVVVEHTVDLLTVPVACYTVQPVGSP